MQYASRILLIAIVALSVLALVVAVKARAEEAVSSDSFRQYKRSRQYKNPEPEPRELHCPFPLLPFIDPCATYKPNEQTCEIKTQDGLVKRVPCPKGSRR